MKYGIVFFVLLLAVSLLYMYFLCDGNLKMFLLLYLLAIVLAAILKFKLK